MKIPIQKPVWEIFSSTELDITATKAVELGWVENKVQIRRAFQEDAWHYIVEPYDGCSCPAIIKYDNKYTGGAK
jgi:hypothetical protein